jgi:polyisoprenyl-teichoic acid--peptidoglycan teichoic acid transferase
MEFDHRHGRPDEGAQGEYGSIPRAGQAPVGSAPVERLPARRGGPRHGATARRAPEQRTIGRALLAAAVTTVVPGSGHLLLRRHRTGAAILMTFLLLLGTAAGLARSAGAAHLLALAFSSRVLLGTAIACVVLALLWMAIIVRTYVIARPRPLGRGRGVLGGIAVAMLCLVVAAPLGFAADLTESQRSVVNRLFPAGPAGGAAATAAPTTLPARLDVLLVGSDAGPDRAGTRSDSMMVANIDTATSRVVIFGLPRNIEHAPFPPGSPMAARFPKGFFDPGDPLSGNYLLNAEYTYGTSHPELAPTEPTNDPGLNLLMSSVGEMLGLPVDYYLKVDMAGFAAVIDAIGGVTIDVGPVPLPIGGVLPDGTHVPPSGYVPAGIHHLDGNQALWYTRSRRNSDDYARMSRQRCLIATVLKQKSLIDLLTHFQAVAAATKDSVSTDIPQSFLPGLAALAGHDRQLRLDGVAFDPSLPDPHRPHGKFDPADPDFGYMRQVVAATISGPPAGTAANGAPTASSTAGSTPPGSTAANGGTAAVPAAAPVPLADSCASPPAESSATDSATPGGSGEGTTAPPPPAQ